MTTRADVTSVLTVALSGIGLFFSKTNSWITEYMPTITAFGILAGTIMTAWYYWQQIEQRKLDRRAKYGGRRKSDPPDN